MGCSHCSDLDDGSTCERCAIVLKFMTYGREFLRPDDASLSRVKKALRFVDRSNEKAVWKALLSAAPSGGKIPLLARDDKNTFLTTKELNTWKNYQVDYSQENDVDDYDFTPPTVYLPGYKRLDIGGPYLDSNEWHHWCNIPLADMADMFIESDGNKVGFSRWPELISLLEILVHSLHDLPYDCATPPNGWFQNRVDRCVPEITNEDDLMFADLDPFLLRHCTPHPFIRHSSNLIDIWPVKIFHTKENEYLPLMWKKSRKLLGDVAANWHDILSQEDDTARAAMYVPTFVTVKQRVHLLVRAEHGYSLIHVPRDFEVWRQLISLNLYHPSTEQNRYLRAIQWEIMCEEEPQFVGPMPEMRALKFLANIYQSLDGLVEVVDDYFVVKGKSSLYYSVRPVGRTSNIGIEIRAFRNQEQTTSPANGVRICIVFGDYSPLPIGDKIAAYLLTLSDDVGSAANISTLQMLHHTWFQSRFSHTDGGWKEMLEQFPHGFQEDEPEWDDEWDEEELENHVLDNDDELVHAEDALPNQQADHAQEITDNDTWEMEAEARGEAHCI